MGDFGDRFAFLLAFSDYLGGVSEGQNGQHVNVFGDAQERLDIGQVPESYSVRTDSFRPGCQDHRLNGPARIRHRIDRFLHGNDNRQGRLGDVRSGAGKPAQFFQCFPIFHDDEMPGLTIHAAGSEMTCLNDPVDDLWWYRFILVSAYS